MMSVVTMTLAISMTNKQHNDDVFLKQEAKLLLNNEVRIKLGSFAGHVGYVNDIMADGRTLDITLHHGKDVFIDVSLVGEVQEPYRWRHW